MNFISCTVECRIRNEIDAGDSYYQYKTLR